MSAAHAIVTLANGALAMTDAGSGEVMHPGTGPLEEARVLYLEPSRLRARLEESDEPELVVFDVGLGAGSNAMAAWHASEMHPAPGKRLALHSFESDLSSFELALEHPEAFGMHTEASRSAARTLLERGTHETPRTTWHLHQGDVRAHLGTMHSAHIVFWDLYSPRHDETLWSTSVFTTLRRACAGHATVHTYSSSTRVRAALLLAGFFVGLGTPTGTKTSTTMASTVVSTLEHPLGARWLARFGRSSAPLGEEEAATAASRHLALDAIARHPQFAT